MRRLLLFVLLVLLGQFFQSAAASSLTPFYDFTGVNGDGASPSGGVVADGKGNLYGTTFYGGTGSAACGSTGCGTVYELIPPTHGSTNWSEQVLYSFVGGASGGYPSAVVTIGTSGELYGTTLYGGLVTSNCPFGCGTVFELAPPAAGQSSWTETVLYTFQGMGDGGIPYFPVTLDSNGNLFGATYYFGNTGSAACMPADQPPGCGVVFELSPPVGGGAPWVETVLHSFSNTPDGAYPSAGVIFDKSGNLFGVTAYGGASYGGAVFRLLKPTSGTIWTPQIVYSFVANKKGAFPSGHFPFDPLTIGNDGLYGTTRFGGNGCTTQPGGCGVVFRLTEPSTGKVPWSESILWDFKGPVKDGAYPTGGVTFNIAQDQLFGTTGFGGNGPCQVDPGTFADGCGTIFKLTRPADGKTKWIEKVLYDFQGGTDGKYPSYGITGVTLDTQGFLASTYNPAPQAGSSPMPGLVSALSVHHGALPVSKH